MVVKSGTCLPSLNPAAGKGRGALIRGGVRNKRTLPQTFKQEGG